MVIDVNSNFSFAESNTQAPYLIILIFHAFIPAVTFLPFNFDLRNFFTLLMYSLFTLSFISIFMIESNCNIPKYLYPSRSYFKKMELLYFRKYGFIALRLKNFKRELASSEKMALFIPESKNFLIFQ